MNVQRMKWLGLAVAMACIVPATSFAQCPDTDMDGNPGSINGNLIVSDTAAMEGECGLEILYAGSTAFVQDNSPNNEKIYRASFLFDPSPANMPSPSVQTLLEGFGTIGPNFGVTFRLQLYKNNHGAHRLFVLVFTNQRAKRASGTFRIGLPGVPPDAGRVCFEWQAAGTNQGFARFAYVDQASSCPSDPGDYITKFTTNEFWNLTGIKLGVARPPAAAATGSMYFDSFESFRTLAP